MNIRIYRLNRFICLLALAPLSLPLTSLCARTEIHGIEKSDTFGTYQQYAPGICGGTLPRVELLAGVLSHTSWMERRGPVGPGNRYFAYQVIREQGASADVPSFGSSVNVELLSLHELGHAFVNPSLKAHGKLIDELRLIDFYQKVEIEMKNQAYGTVSTFLNESVLRAVTAIGYGDLAGNNEVEYHWSKREKSRGFFLQDVIVASLLKYRGDRKRYPTFRDYVPLLLQDISDARADLLEE